MTKVYITVGVPSSGKSSWSKERVSRDGVKTIRFSSDDIRDAVPDLTHAEVFGMMQKGVRSCLESGLYDEIYYDATNINRKRRRGLYRNIKSWDKNAEVIIRFFSVSYEYAKHMNKKRTGNARVPNDVILKMHRQLQVPRLNVDCDRFEVTGIPVFDNLRHIEESMTTQELLLNASPNDGWWTEISMIIDMEHQCPPHHLESVMEHIDMCIKNADTKVLKQIARFHDLGKGITKIIDNSGYATYRGHSDVSAHYFLNYLALTKYKDKDIPEFELDILETIMRHMDMHNELGKKNIRNNNLTDKIIGLGTEFAKIDDKSRIRGEF